MKKFFNGFNSAFKDVDQIDAELWGAGCGYLLIAFMFLLGFTVLIYALQEFLKITFGV